MRVDNNPSDMRLNIGAWSEDILNDNVRTSINKVNMWCASNSSRPPGDLVMQQQIFVDYVTGLWIRDRVWAALHSWETNIMSKGYENPLKEKSARNSKF